MKIAHDQGGGLSRILPASGHCQGGLGKFLTRDQQFGRAGMQLFSHGQGCTFGNAVAAGAFKGDL